MLVPKVLIPLAEARNYQIKVENKQRKLEQKVAESSTGYEFWKLVRAYFIALNPIVAPPQSAWQGDWYQMTIGSKFAHYEWMIKKRKRRIIEVAIHFEAQDQQQSLNLAESLCAKCPELGNDLAYPVEIGTHGTNNAFVQFAIPYDLNFVTDDLAKEAARVMDTMVRQTLHALKDI